VLTNVNDLAAMGAEPLAIVDTLTGDRDRCRAAMQGMKYASGLYDVPVVGGHLTITSGPPSLSAFGLGSCGATLSATSARPGQRLLLLACLEGTMREDFPFFRSFDERGRALGEDVRLLPALAASGACAAAKDVSMAGFIGSLAMLLEPTRCGVSIDVRSLPRPDAIPLERWLVAFPCYAFLLCAPPERAGECVAAAARRGLCCDEIGTLDVSGRIRLRDATHEIVAIDLAVDQITGLRGRDG
jgi:selenophosphate synthetase-related protein